MIAAKLAEIERFLAPRGIALEITRQPPLSESEIISFEQTLGYPVPGDLREIYLEYANGFMVFWEEDRSPRDFDFARFSLPSLEEFVRDTARFQEQVREQLEDLANYFDRIEEARAVLDWMRSWGVLWDDGGDGNLVCLDLKNGAVVFHEREWSFYDAYINGYLIAPSVSSLIEDWGSVCFLNFPGCPGDCPAPGVSAIPDYSQQKFNMANSGKQQ
jgi:hypothetical protein